MRYDVHNLRQRHWKLSFLILWACSDKMFLIKKGRNATVKTKNAY